MAMYMNLYEINDLILQAFEKAVDPETGEIIDEMACDNLNALQMEFDQKAENVLLLIKDLDAEAQAIKTEKLALQSRQAAVEHRSESLKKYIKGALNGEKFRTSRVAVSYRKTQSVDVEDIRKVPEEYLRYAEPTVDKNMVKEALKEGTGIPGVKLVENRSMIIK